MTADSPGRWSLAVQTAVVTTTVAVVAVVITGVVSLGLVRDATEEQARRTLGDQADLVAATLDRRQELIERAARRVPPQLRTLLNAQEIGLELLAPEAAGAAGLSGVEVASLAAGNPVSSRVTTGGVDTFVEARRTEAGQAVVLTQPATSPASCQRRVGAGCSPHSSSAWWLRSSRALCCPASWPGR